jgi:hypothetical protein
MVTIDTTKIAEAFTKHGGAFDRGSADSHYNRPRDPHSYPNGTYNDPKVEALPGSPEYEAYMLGYDYNEAYGDKKDWG